MSQSHLSPVFTGKNIPLPCFSGTFQPGSAVGISEEYLLQFSRIFNLGPGFKNSKLLLFFYHLFLPFPCCFLFITKVQLERGRETEILLCFELSVGPKTCASEKQCCSPKGHPSLLLCLAASPPYMRENP